jgi:ribose transport system substrate-binding protein
MRRLALATLLVSVVAALAASALTAGRTQPSARTAGGDILIGWASPVQSNPGLIGAYRGMQLAAAQLGFKMKVLDSNLSSDKQVSDVDTFVSLGAKGIIAWPLNPGALTGALKRAHDKGIAIVTYATPTPFSNSTVYNHQFFDCTVANDQASYIAKRIPHAKVLIIGPPPVPSLVIYTKCFASAAKRAGLAVVAQRDNVGDTATTAQPLVEDMLAKHPDVQAIWCFNDPSALGAGAVVRSHGGKVWIEGKQKGVIITGTSGNNDAVDGIKKGVMTATWDQNSTEFGAAAVEAIAVHLKFGKPLSAMPKTVIIHENRLDASSIANYVSPLKRPVKLNFKFTNR